MHGCCTGPFEAPGHPCTELSGRLAHSGSLQGASESSQGYRSRPHPFSWSQDERQEECAPSISTNRISSNSFGFRSDAGPFGSCPDTSFYSMFGPLQARPSCLCRYLPQAVGPYGSSLPCVAPRAASHEVIPLVDEGAEVTPHCTSYSPYQSVAQLLSTPVNVARPRLSPERGENGCNPPSPYDHDGCINDRLGRGLRRKALNYCRTHHIDLATVQNNEDLVRLQEAAGEQHFFGFAWIGLYNDIDSWRWSYNEESLVFKSWTSGQPDNSNGGQACAAINYIGGWQDFACANTCYFMCYDGEKHAYSFFIDTH